MSEGKHGDNVQETTFTGPNGGVGVCVCDSCVDEPGGMYVHVGKTLLSMGEFQIKSRKVESR